MKTTFLPRFVPAAASLLLLPFLAACSFLPTPKPDPTRHYVLTGPEVGALNESLGRGVLKVGVRSVNIAPYLDGKSMIVRRGENEIDYRDFARWAEPLSVSINRMLVARLHLSDKVARVFPQPYPFDVSRDVDVAVSVLRCEGRVKSDGTAVVSLVCGIEIVRVAGKDGGGGEVLVREVLEAPEIPWSEGDYAALAQGLSDGVAKLAEAIAERLPSE
jgi:uncharacterized lipoprotein YmbA